MLALTGGRLLTITGGVIEDGIVLIDDGRIVAVGGDVEVPAGAEVIDCRGKTVTPGFIDAHSHLGVAGEPRVPATLDLNEVTDPNTAHLRALDAFNPADPAIPEVRAAGVTCVWTAPGSANVIGGTGLAVKLVGRTVEEMFVAGTEALKMALGENPKRVYGGQHPQPRTPGTRMANAALMRRALVEAGNYEERRAAGNTAEPQGRDLRLETLARALRRELRVRIHSHRADDMLTAVRIAEEFGLDYVIEHATEGYRIAEILADKGVRCTVGPLGIGRLKMELQHVSIKNPGILARAGVKVALQADATSETRWLPIFAGLAVREGMPEDEALRAITQNAAEILQVADRMGSLEAGKDADIAVFDGHPFHTYTKCELVLIDGSVVHRRSEVN